MDEVPTVTAAAPGTQDAGVLAPEPPANAVELGYTVSVDAFSGPLDLLLFLVRKAELDIIDIPVATIADQFVALISQWQREGDLDLEGAGDFILLAATLLEIKARTIAPPPVEDQERATDEADDLLDPRADLIGKLLAYRKFKEAVGILNQLEAERAVRVPRQLREEIPEDPDEAAGIDLGELDVGQLSQLWTALLARLGGAGPRTVMKDDLPIELSIRKLADQAEQQPEISLQGLFAAEPSLQGRVSMLMATLECARQRIVHATQLEQYGDVTLRFRPPAERLIMPVEFPPEEGGKKRRRRPPLVTFQPPVAPSSDEGEDPAAEPEEKHETDEERFLRELNEQCDLDGVLTRVQDVEKGFQQYWEVLHPPAPAPVVIPAAEPPRIPEAVAEFVPVVVTAVVAEAEVTPPVLAAALTPVAEAVPPVEPARSEMVPPVAETAAGADVTQLVAEVVPAEGATTVVSVERTSKIPAAVIPAVEFFPPSVKVVEASAEPLVTAELVVAETIPAVMAEVEALPLPSEVPLSEIPTTVEPELPPGSMVADPEAIHPAAELGLVPETNGGSETSAPTAEPPLFRIFNTDPITVEIREAEPVESGLAEPTEAAGEALSAESGVEAVGHRESHLPQVATEEEGAFPSTAEPAELLASMVSAAVVDAPDSATQHEVTANLPAPHANREESPVLESDGVENPVLVPAVEESAGEVATNPVSPEHVVIPRDPLPLTDSSLTEALVLAAEVQVVPEPVVQKVETAAVVPVVAADAVSLAIASPGVDSAAAIEPDLPAIPAPLREVASEPEAAPLSVTEPSQPIVPPRIMHRPPPFSRTLFLVLSLGAGAAIALGTGLATLPSGMTIAVRRITEALAPAADPEVLVPTVVPETIAVVIPASRPALVVEPEPSLVAAFTGPADQWLEDLHAGRTTAPVWPVSVPWYACLPVAPLPASVVEFSETPDFTGLPVAALIRDGAWGWYAEGAWMPAWPRIVPLDAFVPDTTPPALSAWVTLPDLALVPVVTFLRPTGWAVLAGRADHVLP